MHTAKHPILRVVAWPAFKNWSNPYTALLYGSMTGLNVEVADFSFRTSLFLKCDILHIHWPDAMFNERRRDRAIVAALVSVLAIKLAKLRGTCIVWTAHDLKEYEIRYPRLSRWMWSWFVSQVDGVITLTETGWRSVVGVYPSLSNVVSTVIPHGHYRDAYENTVSRTEARKRLGLKDAQKVVVFLGSIRHYKNVESLVDAFRDIADRDYRLVIAGRPESDKVINSITLKALQDERILVRPGFIKDAEIQNYLNAADLVVLPYREILNSGSTFLALSFHRPVLVPAKGALLDAEMAFGPDWVKTYSGELTGSIIEKTLAKARDSASSSDPFDSGLEWRDIARDTLCFYERVRHHSFGYSVE